MSYRCINAFAYGDSVFGNGFQIEDGDAILKTHADHFAAVDESFVGRAVEQAEATPGGLRTASPKKKAAPAKKAAAHPAPEPSKSEPVEEK